jgi:5-methylcytosine-specific restriction endonuclease McrA
MSASNDPDARRQEVLRARKSHGEAADRILIDGITDDDPIVREWAIEATVSRKSGVLATPALLGRLQDPRADVRWYAVRALGKLGVQSQEIGDTLERALSDTDEYVRAYAAWAIAALGFEERVAALRKRLTDKESPRRDLEDLSIGLAIARLNTPRTSEPVPQAGLFSEEQLPPPPEPAKLPATRDETLRADLQKVAERVVMDRVGGTVVVSGSIRLTFQAQRSIATKERVVSERGPHCQLCGFVFRKANGEDYAESHHVIPLSEGGPDTDDNLLVLCPNDHKMIHFARVEFPESRARPPVIAINGDTYRVRWD